MIAIALTALTWFKANIKWVVIGICALLGAYFLNSVYNTILENGQYRIHVEEQQKTIANKDKIIKKLEQDKVDVERALRERDAKLQEFELKMEGLTTNLGPNADDQAPEALKEYFRRLKQRLGK